MTLAVKVAFNPNTTNQPYNPSLSQMTDFILFQTERNIADNNFKFDKNGEKFFNRIK